MLVSCLILWRTRILKLLLKRGSSKHLEYMVLAENSLFIFQNDLFELGLDAVYSDFSVSSTSEC